MERRHLTGAAAQKEGSSCSREHGRSENSVVKISAAKLCCLEVALGKFTVCGEPQWIAAAFVFSEKNALCECSFVLMCFFFLDVFHENEVRNLFLFFAWLETLRVHFFLWRWHCWFRLADFCVIAKIFGNYTEIGQSESGIATITAKTMLCVKMGASVCLVLPWPPSQQVLWREWQDTWNRWKQSWRQWKASACSN